MRRSHCHDSSKAGTALLEEAKLPQSFEAIPDGTSCVGMAHADLDTIAFQNAFQKAFTGAAVVLTVEDRKSTRLNSSHLVISYAVFCLKKKKKRSKWS